MPKREFKDVGEFRETTEGLDEILMDGVENTVERKKGYDNQKDDYSGKKGTHTNLALVISDRRKWVYYVSWYYRGANVDFGVLKQEFEPGLGWFALLRVIVDLGFVGIGKLYDIMELVIGYKRPRTPKGEPKSELTKEQKKHNTAVSKQRIFVEHAIGGIKRFRILKNRCRMKSDELRNRVLGVCAGLWNFHLSIKHSISA